MIPYPLDEISWLPVNESVNNTTLPAFYVTQFTLPNDSTNLFDTYLDTTGWNKVRYR